MSGHAPGPWDAQCTYTGPANIPFVPKKSVRVIMSSNPDHDVAYLLNSFSPGEEAANARLMSASPDLLAACEAFLAAMGPAPDAATWHNRLHAARDVARVAVAKARKDPS